LVVLASRYLAPRLPPPRRPAADPLTDRGVLGRSPLCGDYEAPLHPPCGHLSSGKLRPSSTFLQREILFGPICRWMSASSSLQAMNFVPIPRATYGGWPAAALYREVCRSAWLNWALCSSKRPGRDDGLMRGAGLPGRRPLIFFWSAPIRLATRSRRSQPSPRQILSTFRFQQPTEITSQPTRPEKSQLARTAHLGAGPGPIDALERKGWLYTVDEEWTAAFYGPKHPTVQDPKIASAVSRGSSLHDPARLRTCPSSFDSE